MLEAAPLLAVASAASGETRVTGGGGSAVRGAAGAERVERAERARRVERERGCAATGDDVGACQRRSRTTFQAVIRRARHPRPELLALQRLERA